MTIESAFESFIEDGFREACVTSTIGSWSGGTYSVELFADGTWRVLETELFGLLYDSPGIIIEIPRLGEGDWNDDTGHYFLTAQDLMYERYAEVQG